MNISFSAVLLDFPFRCCDATLSRNGTEIVIKIINPLLNLKFNQTVFVAIKKFSLLYKVCTHMAG